MTDPSPPGLPLSGVSVVALEQAVTGPFCSRQLADMGARVIKIERPDTGDFARDYDGTLNGLSAYFAWLLCAHAVLQQFAKVTTFLFGLPD